MNKLQRSIAAIALAFAFALPTYAASQVDINSADAKTLAEGLHGVGLGKAEAIVAYRAAHGPFKNADELARVKGIGPKTIARNRDAIMVSESVPAPADGNRNSSAPGVGPRKLDGRRPILRADS